MLTKTFSFAAVHMTVAFCVGYLMTGSWAVGGALAIVEPVCNTVAYHERDRTSLTQPSGEGCTLEDGTAHFCG